VTLDSNFSDVTPSAAEKITRIDIPNQYTVVLGVEASADWLVRGKSGCR
jgi:hypothetical protein